VSERLKAVLIDWHSGDNALEHKLTKFFLTISIFITGISVLAIYATTMGAEYTIKKDDTQAQSVTHLLNATDWWNDYQAHKLREKMFQMEIDNLNQSTSASRHIILSKYQSYLSKLYANKSVIDSFANLKDKAQTEQKLYEQSVITSSHYSKVIEWYDFATILLIIGIGLGGISEIAKNKLLGIPSLVIGGLGVIVLLLISFTTIY
jgi:Domain of unknown function (DUF4337)